MKIEGKVLQAVALAAAVKDVRYYFNLNIFEVRRSG